MSEREPPSPLDDLDARLEAAKAGSEYKASQRADGMGAGVVDLCVEEGWDVVEIQSGSSAVEVEDWDTTMQFVNLRSQMWFWASKQREEGLVSFGVEDVAKTKLREDLLAPRYRVEKKGEHMTVSVEPKDSRSKAWGIK